MKICEKENSKVIIEDAGNAEKVVSSFSLVRDDVMGSLEVEMKQHMMNFSVELGQVVSGMKQKMKGQIMESLGKFKGMDQDTIRRLGTAIDYGSKPFDQKTIESVLIQNTSGEVLAKAGECFQSQIELASDYVFEKISESLDELLNDILDSKKEEKAKAELVHQKSESKSIHFYFSIIIYFFCNFFLKNKTKCQPPRKSHAKRRKKMMRIVD